MLSYLRRLFYYAAWANQQSIASLESLAASDSKAAAWMGHVLVAERLWHMRLTGQPINAVPDLFPVHSAAELRAQADESRKMWDAYFAGLTEAALAGNFAYKTTEGKPYESKVADALTHVVNHGTYHRGQIAARVRELGGKPNPTDFVVFTRLKS